MLPRFQMKFENQMNPNFIDSSVSICLLHESINRRAKYLPQDKYTVQWNQKNKKTIIIKKEKKKYCWHSIFIC